jgi:hypothetical protein
MWSCDEDRCTPRVAELRRLVRASAVARRVELLTETRIAEATRGQIVLLRGARTPARHEDGSGAMSSRDCVEIVGHA